MHKSKEGKYISKGYCNATVNFTAHDKSSCHKEAILKVVTLPATTRNVGEELFRQYFEQLLERCFLIFDIWVGKAFLYVVTAPRRTLTISNFYSCEEMISWLQKKTDKYISEVQNELLKIMAHQVLRKIEKKSPRYQFFDSHG